MFLFWNEVSVHVYLPVQFCNVAL